MMFWTCAFVLATYFLFIRLLRSLKVGNYGDKYVLITGCDSGFGRDLTIKLNRLGFQVFAGCLTEKGKSAVQKSCSPNVKPFILDVTQEESIQDALNFVTEHLPQGKGLWALVNNAGIAGTVALTELLIKKNYQDSIEVNLLGPIQMVQTFLPLLRKACGRVVNITSVMGRFAGVSAPYCVSKFGFEGYLDVLRRELYTQGIKVSILEPGFFETNIVNRDALLQSIQQAYDKASDEVKDFYGIQYVNKMKKLVEGLQASHDTNWVVDSYVHAITSRFPKTRYVVGWDAIFFYIPLSYLPDWLSDPVFDFFKKVMTARK